MAYLNKEAYESKREWAAKRMADNQDLGTENGLTEEQCEVLSKLCSMRHDLHTSGTNTLYNDEHANHCEYYNWLDDYIHDMLAESGLKNKLRWNTDGLLRCCDWYEEYVIDEEDKEKYNNDVDVFREKTLEEISEFLEKVNSDIEDFLRKIDKKYGTNYCPSGATRIY